MRRVFIVLSILWALLISWCVFDLGRITWIQQKTVHVILDILD